MRPSWPSASAPGAWSEAVIFGILAAGARLVIAVLPSQDQGAKAPGHSLPGSCCPSIEALGAVVGEAGGAAPLVAKLCRCVSGSMQTKAQKSLQKGVGSPVRVQAQIARQYDRCAH